MTKAEKCKKWREDNPGHKEIKNEARKKRYWEEPEYRKAELRKVTLRAYKMAPEKYDSKLKEQGGMQSINMERLRTIASITSVILQATAIYLLVHYHGH